MSIKVLTCQEIKDACEKNGTEVCKITAPKSDKDYKGCMFYPHRFVVGSDVKDVFKTNDVEEEHIMITRDLPDPNDPSDDRNDFKMTIETRVGKSGVFGQTLLAYNKVFMEKAMAVNKQFKWDIPKKRSLKGYMQTHYSDECPDEALRGAEREDDSKIIRIKILPFEIYTNHFNKKMIGQPKTIIYDYSTRKVQPDGTVVYERATVDGEPLSPQNIFMFLTSGSIIRKARFRSGTVARAKSTVSPELVADKIYVQHMSREYDDDVEVVDAPPKTGTTPVTTPAVADVVATADTPTPSGEEPAESTTDESALDSVLDDLIN